MEVVYSGRDVKRLLNESIPSYKPRIDGNASSENEKINKKANKESIANTKIDVKDEGFKPVIDREQQSTDIGNNKNMLDLQFDNDPGKDYLDRVEKLVTGEDSTYGNNTEDEDAIAGNKAFYDAAKKASNNFTGIKNELENSGIVGKSIPVPQKATPFSKPGKPQTKNAFPIFKEEDNRYKKLHFKNTQFLNEKHMLSLIPEDYKINENKFVMKDKNEDEYLIEWKVETSSNISEPIIVKHENKKKIQEEFERMRALYGYKSKEHFSSLNNNERLLENSNFSKNIEKLRDITE